MVSLTISAWIRRAMALLLLAALLAAGCGAPTGEVSGVVTYNGEPLPSGTVTFTNEAVRNRDKIQTGRINSDGNYRIPQCPCGEVQISVQTPPLVEAKFSAMSIPTIEIPGKYTDAGTSGLTYTVTPGSQTFDIKLTGPANPRRVKGTVNPELELKEKNKAKGNP